MSYSQKKYPESIRYIPMIVEALKSMSGVAKASAVKQWIAESLLASNQKIPETVLAGGALKFANDIQWARMYLVNAKILEPMESAGYGTWKLTPEGWIATIDQEGARKIYEATSPKGKTQNSDVQEAPPEESQQVELDGMGSWESTLKKILTSMPPTGFERLCAFIMTKNGLEATVVTGKSGDGGVDGEGMLAFDDLSLIKTPVAWQCKRFNGNNVSSGDVRNFRGSIEGRAKYGLIFATSSFTPSAEIEARRPGATPIELVGLERLIELMGKHEIGVKQISMQMPSHEVKQDFFDEYLKPAGELSVNFDLA